MSETTSTPTRRRSLASTLIRVGLGLVLVLTAVLITLSVVGLLLPADVRVSRSVVIDAPKSEIFPLINDLKRWQEWTTWNRANYPQLQYEFDEQTAGAGAEYRWADPSMGGWLRIDTSDPQEGIQYTMGFDDFDTPVEGSLLLRDHADGTEVIWSFHTTMPFNPVYRWMGLMFDDWIGADFEVGLNSLKRLAEGNAAQRPGTNGQPAADDEADDEADIPADAPSGESDA